MEYLAFYESSVDDDDNQQQPSAVEHGRGC